VTVLVVPIEKLFTPLCEYANAAVAETNKSPAAAPVITNFLNILFTSFPKKITRLFLNFQRACSVKKINIVVASVG
jgi:hypothetical protein